MNIDGVDRVVEELERAAPKPEPLDVRAAEKKLRAQEILGVNELYLDEISGPRNYSGMRSRYLL